MNFSLYYQIQGDSGTHPVSDMVDTGAKAVIVTTQLHPLIRSVLHPHPLHAVTAWLMGKERSNSSHKAAFTYTYNSKTYV